MKLSFKKYLRLVALVVISSLLFPPSLFIGVVNAAPISKSNPIILHITNSRFTDTAVTARQNLLQGAFKQGGATAQQQMQANLDNGNIQIAKDAASAWDDSTSYLTFEGKPKGGYGEKGIQDGFKEILSDPNNLPPGTPGAQPQENDVICIVPRPGQNTDYGPLTDKPFPVLGQVRDVEAVHPIINGHVADESETNFELRKLGSKTWEEEKAAAAANPPKTGTQKFAANPPTEAQAKEYIASMGGNPNARGSYNINGTKVPVGQYKANDTNDRTGIVFDDKCENPKSVPKVKDPGTPGGQQFSSPNQPGSGGNPGSGGDEGLGGLGGLGQMLPLLLASMLGGGLGGQGGQGQNGVGSNGYGNGLTNTQTSCSQYGVSPVCGSDGKTYNNSCWLQQLGQVQVSAGVCPTTSTSTSSTPDVAKIVTRLLAAGVPQSVIDTIVRSLVAFTSHANGPDVVVQ